MQFTPTLPSSTAAVASTSVRTEVPSTSFGSLKCEIASDVRHQCSSQSTDPVSDISAGDRSVTKARKLYQCQQCHKRFSQRGHLTRHMRTHTHEKPFECETCLKRFSQSCNLTAHMRTHTPEKPFECETCHKWFSKKSSLTRHMRTHTHTQAKPFECETCHKRFSVKSSLTRHMFTHTKEKPFECETCHKRFSVKSSLTRHMFTHTKEKPSLQPLQSSVEPEQTEPLDLSLPKTNL